MTNDDFKPQSYPDLSMVFSAKQERRAALAALPWEEKIAIVEKMQSLLPKDAWQGSRHKVETAAQKYFQK